MFRNYFKTAWRNLKNNKFYSTLHISGLAIGLATATLLLLWAQEELSFDTFHKDYRSTYRMSSHMMINGQESVWETTPAPMAVYAQSMPAVQSLLRIDDIGDQVLTEPQQHKLLPGNEVAYADSNFFRFFDFPLVEGDPLHALDNPESIVISQAMARRYFGEASAMGKTLDFGKSTLAITGVMKDFPENSSLQYDAIIPMGFYAQLFTKEGGNGNWKTIDEDLGNYSFYTYVKLQPGVDAQQAGVAFTDAYTQARKGDNDTKFQLQALAEMHLTGSDGNQAPLKMVRIFVLIAILLLAIASINYVNLSTARSLVRAKEVSVRKIIGAGKKQLLLQFIVETLLLFAIATALAILLMTLLTPLYERISDKHLGFALLNTRVWKVILVALLGTMLAVSIYPALVLSSFKPIEALKGRVTAGIGAAMFRRILVVFQFSISIALIVGTMIIGRQLQYVRHKNLGYNKDYVFTVRLPRNAVKHVDAIKTELARQPSIYGVSATGVRDISMLDMATGDIEWPGKPDDVDMIIAQAPVDENFIPTMKMQMLEGENFKGVPGDETHYIINEAAVRELGLKAPYLGQKLTFHSREGTIAGVVKDFHFRSLREKITPLIFFTRWGWGSNILYIRTSAGKATAAIEATREQYKKYAGDYPFVYQFVDQQFDAKYKTDQQAGVLFNCFAGLAIFISCLGLLGLATYTAQVRIKEIGVRKVLGASVANLVRLLAKDFLLLVLVAIVLAVPVAWWLMDKWLEEFAYRTQLAWWIFVLAGGAAILIALVTVSFQAVRAALANPVKSLRSE